MDLSAVPYLVQSREVDFGFAVERVYVSMCLLNPLVVGIGFTRDEALAMMVTERGERAMESRELTTHEKKVLRLCADGVHQRVLAQHHGIGAKLLNRLIGWGVLTAERDGRAWFLTTTDEGKKIIEEKS